MIRTLRFMLVAGLSALATATVPAAEVTLKVEEKAPPQELPSEITGVLQGKSIRLSHGDKTAYEFWLRSEIPVTSAPESPAKSLDVVKQAALIGAVRIGSDSRDYRDDELAAGLYTMRFGLQPSDGNHLGTAEFSYFAVLIPAKYDARPDGITDYKAMVKASSKGTSTDHPLILSLRPVADGGGTLPSLTEPKPAHKSVRVRVPGKSGQSKAELIFELVFEGRAKE